MSEIRIDFNDFLRETEGFSEIARKTWFLEKYYEPALKEALAQFCPLCGARLDIKEKKNDVD